MSTSARIIVGPYESTKDYGAEYPTEEACLAPILWGASTSPWTRSLDYIGDWWLDVTDSS